MAMDATRAQQVLDAIHAVTPLVASVAPIRTRYMTANGTATSNGTELSTSGGYTSGTGAPSTTWGAATGSSPSTSTTTAAVTTTNMPATTVNGVEEWDSAGTPKRQSFGALTTPRTTNAGDTFSIAAGQLTETQS